MASYTTLRDELIAEAQAEGYTVTHLEDGNIEVVFGRVNSKGERVIRLGLRFHPDGSATDLCPTKNLHVVRGINRQRRSLGLGSVRGRAYR